MANFDGVASSVELFVVIRYISVPLAAVAVWLLIVKGRYARVEKVVIPNGRYRNDIGLRFIREDHAMMKELGWLE